MKDDLLDFIEKIEGFTSKPLGEQILFFAYFLLKEKKYDGVSPSNIHQCFIELLLHPHSNIPLFMRDNSKRKNKNAPKFLIKNKKYYLTLNAEEKISELLSVSLPKQQTSAILRSLLPKIKNNSRNVFFEEAIKCFEIGAYRASIIMVWNLCMDHIFEYILTKEINSFNSVLLSNTDKRIKISEVKVKDDFSEIPENKFVEFCRSAKIISNDVRKILDVKLGIRNSAAHPSNIEFSPSKSIEFIEDIVNNVILKYDIH